MRPSALALFTHGWEGVGRFLPGRLGLGRSDALSERGLPAPEPGSELMAAPSLLGDVDDRGVPRVSIVVADKVGVPCLAWELEMGVWSCPRCRQGAAGDRHRWLRCQASAF